MSEHSKLPWAIMQLGKDTIIIDRSGFGIDLKNEAPRICLAVNSHNALVNALQGFIADCTWQTVHGEVRRAPSREIIETARAALEGCKDKSK